MEAFHSIIVGNLQHSTNQTVVLRLFFLYLF